MCVCVCTPDASSAHPCVTYKSKALWQALQAMGTLNVVARGRSA